MINVIENSVRFSPVFVFVCLFYGFVVVGVFFVCVSVLLLLLFVFCCCGVVVVVVVVFVLFFGGGLSSCPNSKSNIHIIN